MVSRGLYLVPSLKALALVLLATFTPASTYSARKLYDRSALADLNDFDDIDFTDLLHRRTAFAGNGFEDIDFTDLLHRREASGDEFGDEFDFTDLMHKREPAAAEPNRLFENTAFKGRSNQRRRDEFENIDFTDILHRRSAATGHEVGPEFDLTDLLYRRIPQPFAEPDPEGGLIDKIKGLAKPKKEKKPKKETGCCNQMASGRMICVGNPKWGGIGVTASCDGMQKFDTCEALEGPVSIAAGGDSCQDLLRNR
jgi:hypothetical protein